MDIRRCHTPCPGSLSQCSRSRRRWRTAAPSVRGRFANAAMARSTTTASVRGRSRRHCRVSNLATRHSLWPCCSTGRSVGGAVTRAGVLAGEADLTGAASASSRPAGRCSPAGCIEHSVEKERLPRPVKRSPQTGSGARSPAPPVGSLDTSNQRAGSIPAHRHVAAAGRGGLRGWAAPVRSGSPSRHRFAEQRVSTNRPRPKGIRC